MSAPVQRPARSWKWPRASRGTAPAADDRAAGDVACRNCGAEAPGAYCPSCGQETALELPRAGQFMREAAGRYVALDGRMGRTLFALLFRPGFLTREYLAGRRKRYVRPARLVLVLAIVLFASARLLADPDVIVHAQSDTPVATSAARQAGSTPASAPAASPAAKPSTQASAAAGPASGRASLVEVDVGDTPLTIGSPAAGLRIDDALNVHLVGVDLPLGARIEKRLESFNKLDLAQKSREIVAGMLRYGPYALIAMLPVFALLMQVLYAGRKRRYPDRPRRYAEHLVYGAHNHAFVALAGTLALVVQARPATLVLAGWTTLYLLWSMRTVYGGRWAGVLARGFVALVVYAAMFVFAIAGLVVAAVVLR
jgi:hypothetical protein